MPTTDDPPQRAWYPRRRLSGHPITIVMYHAVSREADPYSVTPEAFRRQIEHIASRYAVVRLRDLPALLAQPRPRQRLVAITFDDAYCDFEVAALPVLMAAHAPVTVFAPTGQLGGYNRWDAGGPLPRRAVMSADRLRAVHQSGLVDIGSHTVDHVRMAAQTGPEMWRQAADSRQALEAVLGTEIRLFSYPYGQLRDFSRQTERVLRRAGYQVAVTTHWGTRVRPSELLRLKRVWLNEEDRGPAMEAKIEGAYDWRGWKERMGFAARRLGLRR